MEQFKYNAIISVISKKQDMTLLEIKQAIKEEFSLRWSTRFISKVLFTLCEKLILIKDDSSIPDRWSLS